MPARCRSCVRFAAATTRPIRTIACARRPASPSFTTGNARQRTDTRQQAQGERTRIVGSKKTAAHSARRLGQFETNRTLLLHVLVRQMTRRILGGARLAL